MERLSCVAVVFHNRGDDMHSRTTLHQRLTEPTPQTLYGDFARDGFSISQFCQLWGIEPWEYRHLTDKGCLVVKGPELEEISWDTPIYHLSMPEAPEQLQGFVDFLNLPFFIFEQNGGDEPQLMRIVEPRAIKVPNP